MEEIAQLKAKHVTENVSVLKDLLLTEVKIVDEIKRSQNQQFSEDESKIEELTSKLAVMRKALCKETQTLERKNNELSKYNDHLKELESKKKQLLQEMKQLEEKQNSLKSAKPNLQDQQVLEQGRKKLRLYKDFTKIQWDYESSKHSIRGYVSNKHDYIHHFSYDNQEISNKIINSLWHNIYLSTDASKVTNENFQPNIPTDIVPE